MAILEECEAQEEVSKIKEEDKIMDGGKRQAASSRLTILELSDEEITYELYPN